MIFTESVDIFTTKKWLWKPMQDITAYEVAVCMELYAGYRPGQTNPPKMADVIAKCGEGVKRHFTEVT